MDTPSLQKPIQTVNLSTTVLVHAGSLPLKEQSSDAKLLVSVYLWIEVAGKIFLGYGELGKNV